MKWTSRVEPAAKWLLAGAGLAMVVEGVALYHTMRDLREATEWVTHTETVLRTIGAFREQFLQIESAQRGYLLTGAPALLIERRDAELELNAAAAELARLTQDNTLQQTLLERLNVHARARLAIARENEDLRLWSGFVAPWPQQELDRARQASDEVLALTREMENEEQKLLAMRRTAHEASRRQSSIYMAAAFAGFALILIPAFWAMLYETRRRRRSESQMGAIVEALPLAVWQMRADAEGKRRFTYVGGSSETELGLSAERLQADPGAVRAIVLPEDLPIIDEAFRRAQADGGVLDCVHRVRAADGRIRSIHLSARHRRDAAGSLLWTGFWMDITPRVELEAALRQATETAHAANAAKSTFLATMSHEIRTPLNGMLGLLELLGLTRLDPDQRATLRVVRESGRSLAGIIDDVLDFSKIEAGKLELRPRSASVAAKVKRACETFRGIASSRGILLEAAVDPDVAPALVFDGLRLSQVLNNLVSNAVKFTEAGWVRIIVESLQRTPQAQTLVFTVQDTGVGISEEAAQRLFQPFSQADAQGAAPGGTGLGLTICKRLVELMGGTIRLHSKPGEGTRVEFEVTFPIGDEAELALHGTSRDEHLPQLLERRRAAPSLDDAEADGSLVLVVDDHPTNRLVLCRQVTTLGYAVISAENGVQALSLWRERRVGLVLTDCNMPEMSGYALAEAIRKEERKASRPRTPIIACTASALPGEAARCLAAGMDDCLVKPVDLLALLQHLDRWRPVGAEAPADDAAPQQEGIFDAERVLAISMGDVSAERTLLLDFQRTNDLDLASLAEAAAWGRMDEVLRLAHRIKGAAYTLHAMEVFRACEDVERMARHGDDLAAAIEALRLAAERLNGRIARFLDERRADA